ncbi:MAG TPA: virulence RhuM family protein [Candidatus Onthousia faecipullorum]|uniref:Virulence RhuM family protein n=1 Tax=Candidatus Onthousia faecipullorum TaxID=2840887 RepID=A0A9D1KBR0_9FIRM|nr:virulence RhuM family protein [Candidatus Onthousia faecipullorum]
MSKSNIVIYTSKDGVIKVDTTIVDDTIWMSQNELAKLFDTTKNNISSHMKNIFESGELEESSTVKNFLTVQKEGTRNVKRMVTHYNLDAIIAVGYRINSKRATDFRIWATKILKEYMIKGFSLNDEFLKNNGESPYFEELLARIREIRSSEKVFWRKVLDIYATSIDYNPKSEISINFFKTVQNKMHYAAHGNTAAEVIFTRVDANKDNLGLTNFKGDMPTREETEIAKNYLTEEELNILNRMVSAYLDVAEINALDRHPMTMKDWIMELDSFLKMTRKNILTNAGSVSHEEALKKAHEEYDKYMQSHLTRAEKDYLEIMNIELMEIEKNN